MEKIKIGVIGVGGISECHINAYLKNPNVELYAFCDINEKRLKEMSEKYSITRTFTDMNDMLKLKEIDAVSVCTWNSAHAVCTIAALNAGKHVLCEKPMAMSAQEGEDMKAAAIKNNKLLMIGFVRRYGDDCAVLKDFVNTDYFGDIYYAKANYLRRNGNPGGWFGDKSRSGGGPLIDLGVHVIDLVRYVLGNPKPISAYGVTFHKLGNRNELKDKKDYLSISATPNDKCDVEDLVSALIRFDNGAVLDVEASFSLNIKAPVGKIELFGDKGGAKIESDLEMYTIVNERMANVTLDQKVTMGDFFQHEINHYVDCVINNTTCVSPADDGITIMKILDAIYESARTGHEVVIK